MLDCYLRKNLASQGGYLDEVRFVVRTENATDVTWVDALVAGQPDYTRVEVSINSTFASIYEEHMLDRSAVYIKIDDDIVSLLSLPPRACSSNFRMYCIRNLTAWISAVRRQ